MSMTFLQKIALTIVAAFAFACLIEFYKQFVQGADDAINGAYRPSAGITAKK
jgi:hypothetical protein